jgi:TRAP-type C4-dicarboxylate transport system permease small subunit
MILTASDRSPAASLPVGLFYASGVVFGVSAAVILLYDAGRVLFGNVREEELVAVRESEEA